MPELIADELEIIERRRQAHFEASTAFRGAPASGSIGGGDDGDALACGGIGVGATDDDGVVRAYLLCREGE
jgi:hypothetical protein